MARLEVKHRREAVTRRTRLAGQSDQKDQAELEVTATNPNDGPSVTGPPSWR